MLSTIMLGDIVHAKCERCHEYKRAHSQGGYSIEGGIRVKFIGGYADYYDPMDANEQVYIDICHECTVEVLKFIGIYDHEKFRGGHPAEETACCDNCWIPYYEDGKWVGTRYPTGKVVMHKKM